VAKPRIIVPVRTNRASGYKVLSATGKIAPVIYLNEYTADVGTWDYVSTIHLERR
jgi:hypothetical protein